MLRIRLDPWFVTSRLQLHVISDLARGSLRRGHPAHCPRADRWGGRRDWRWLRLGRRAHPFHPQALQEASRSPPSGSPVSRDLIRQRRTHTSGTWRGYSLPCGTGMSPWLRSTPWWASSRARSRPGRSHRSVAGSRDASVSRKIWRHGSPMSTAGWKQPANASPTGHSTPWAPRSGGAASNARTGKRGGRWRPPARNRLLNGSTNGGRVRSTTGTTRGSCRRSGTRRSRRERRRRAPSASCSACITTSPCCAPRWLADARRAAPQA